MYHLYIILIIIVIILYTYYNIYIINMILYDSTIYKINCNYHTYYKWTSIALYMWITPTTILRVKIKILPEFRDVVNDSDRDIICLSYGCHWWGIHVHDGHKLVWIMTGTIPYCMSAVMFSSWPGWRSCEQLAQANLILHVERSDQKSWEVIWSIYSTIINQVYYHNW